MKEVYIVIDSNGYVETYIKQESARKDVIEGLVAHAEQFNYSTEDLAEAIEEFDTDCKAGRITCGTYLGEYEIKCVKSVVNED